MGACAARPTFWMTASALSATPFWLGLSAFVNSCLMQNCLHTAPISLPKNPAQLSDVTVSIFEGTPWACVSPKKKLKTSLNLTYASGSTPMRSKSGYPLLAWLTVCPTRKVFSLVRSGQQKRPNFFAARVFVLLGMGLR